MTAINISSDIATSFTTVSDIFIDQYMPKANGEFVKVYLYLLRATGSGAGIATIPMPFLPRCLRGVVLLLSSQNRISFSGGYSAVNVHERTHKSTRFVHEASFCPLTYWASSRILL